jgi:hypothetical protein
VRGVATAGLGGRKTALIVAPASEGHIAVEVKTSSLMLRAVGGIDPSVGLTRLARRPGSGPARQRRGPPASTV